MIATPAEWTVEVGPLSWLRPTGATQILLAPCSETSVCCVAEMPGTPGAHSRVAAACRSEFELLGVATERALLQAVELLAESLSWIDTQ